MFTGNSKYTGTEVTVPFYPLDLKLETKSLSSERAASPLNHWPPPQLMYIPLRTMKHIFTNFFTEPFPSSYLTKNCDDTSDA